jgi:hypothetical protein
VQLIEAPFDQVRVRQAGDAEWLASGEAAGAVVWVGNARGAIRPVPFAGGFLPLLLSEDHKDSTYVASLLSGWVRYALFEACRQLPPTYCAAVRASALPLTGVLRVVGLHRAAILGNWLVSTNLYPDVGPDDWRQARDAALAWAPDRPLAIRSVCAGVNPALPAQLAGDGWLLVPARQVYLCDPADPATARHNHVRKDRRLLDAPEFVWLTPDELTGVHLPALRRLFRNVYFDKHSPLNPDFSDAFFELCLQRRFLELHALRHAGELVGMLAILDRHGWVTTPLIGYDTSLPQELAIYRRLMARLLNNAARRHARLHYSSGAGSFKRVRGGMPHTEYTAIFVRHLPRPRQAAAHAFAALSRRFAAPLLTRYG